MNRALEVFPVAFSAIRGRLLVVTDLSERTILLGTILLASAVSLVTGFVLARYYSADWLSSLVISLPDDCLLDRGTHVGRHCFSDYGMTLAEGMRPNPWEPFPLLMPPDFHQALNNYSAAGMMPYMTFGFVGKWLHAPQLGLLAYLVALTIACLTPAVWATRGARGLERVMVFVALGVAAIPAWIAIDRGNSVGFLVPVALVFLVALCRRSWVLAAIMVVLAALVKPQFAVLAVALFAARQWRWGGLAVAGAVIANLAAYALWPRDFPATIMQSIHDTLSYGSSASRADLHNVSFAKALLMIPDDIKAGETHGTIPDGFLAGPRSLIGYVVLVLVIVCVVALGSRIPPVMTGIALLTTASLFPALVAPYYLVFALPIAALVARDPNGPPGSGIFDRLETLGDRRRAVGICVTLAAILTIAQMVQIGPPVMGQKMGALEIVRHTLIVLTPPRGAPLLWLIVCAAIIVSYARKPAPTRSSDGQPDPEDSQDVPYNSRRVAAVPSTGS